MIQSISIHEMFSKVEINQLCYIELSQHMLKAKLKNFTEFDEFWQKH